MILELLDKQNSKVNTQIATTKLYPVDPVSTEIVVDNAFLRDGKFIFDLSFNNFDINEFDAIRIVPLNEAEVNTLSGGGLPNNLTNSDKSIIFGKSSDDYFKNVKTAVDKFGNSMLKAYKEDSSRRDNIILSDIYLPLPDSINDSYSQSFQVSEYDFDNAIMGYGLNKVLEGVVASICKG